MPIAVLSEDAGDSWENAVGVSTRRATFASARAVVFIVALTVAVSTVVRACRQGISAGFRLIMICVARQEKVNGELVRPLVR